MRNTLSISLAALAFGILTSFSADAQQLLKMPVQAPSKVVGDLPTVPVAPEGVPQDYKVSGKGIGKDYSGNAVIQNFNNKGTIYWDYDQQKAYLSQLVPGVYGFVEGDLYEEEGVQKIKVQLPQCAQYDDITSQNRSALTYIAVGELQEVDEHSLNYLMITDPADNLLTFTVGENGQVTLDQDFTFESEVVDGQTVYTFGEKQLTSFMEYSDDPGVLYCTFSIPWTVTYTNVGQGVSVPEGLEMEIWTIDDANDNMGSYVSVGFDGDTVYIDGLNEEYEAVTIKGTVEGDKIIFKNQFLKYSTYFGEFIYLVAGKGNMIYDDYYGQYYWGDPSLTDAEGNRYEELVFNYDAEQKRIWIEDDWAMVFNCDETRLYRMCQYVNADMKYEDPAIFEYPVENPSMSFYFDTTAVDGSQSFVWNIVTQNTAGTDLPIENMYFNFYVNEELYYWNAEEIGIESEEEMICDIPMTVNSMNVQYFYGMLFISIFENAPDIHSVGLQTFYRAQSGVYSSDLVTEEVDFGTKVEGIIIDGVQTEEYFDLQGRKIEKPENGFYILRSTDANGKVSVSKHFAR